MQSILNEIWRHMAERNPSLRSKKDLVAVLKKESHKLS